MDSQVTLQGFSTVNPEQLVHRIVCRVNSIGTPGRVIYNLKASAIQQ